MTFLARLRSETRGSIPLAMLAIILVSGLVAALTATTISGQESVRHNQNFSTSVTGADAGVQQALFMLNSGAAALPSVAAPATATVGGTTYSWYAETVTPGLEYKIHSTGTFRGNSRSMVATLAQPPRFPLAAFADTSVTMRGANRATSYDSRSGASDTGNGNVGSNGDVTFNGNATADGVHLYNWADDPDTGRCSGGPCGDYVAVDRPLDITSAEAKAFIVARINACQASGELPAWKASENAGILASGVYCFSSMEFDVDTTVLATPENPVIAYVTGNVSSANHTSINHFTATPKSGALQIYSLGTSVSLGNHVNFGGTIWAPDATCGGNPSNAQSDIYGAVVCRTIGNQGGWQFHYDDALGGIGNGTWGVDHVAED